MLCPPFEGFVKASGPAGEKAGELQLLYRYNDILHI